MFSLFYFYDQKNNLREELEKLSKFVTIFRIKTFDELAKLNLFIQT